MNPYENPYHVDLNYESLARLSRRIAREEGISLVELLNGKRTADEKINHARRRFAYEAYKTGRYSHSRIANHSKLGKEGRTTIIKRIEKFCRDNGLPRPRIMERRKTNLFSRNVVFENVAEA